MTIALDATYSLDPNPSGVAVYCSQLIDALAHSFPDEEFLLCYRARRFLRSLRYSLPEENCSRRLLEDFACSLFSRQVSVFHGLNQRLPRYRFQRNLTTFHDLFVLSGDYSTAEFRSRFSALARDAAGRSDHIIAVSEFTADQISLHFGYPRDQISVIHHGVQPVPNFPTKQLDEFRRQQGLEMPFLLHVGAIQKRKNVTRLVDAFERLNAQFTLVLAGSAGYGAEQIMDRIENSPARARIRALGYVDSDRLAMLYRTASVLVFPSLEEGFGMPVLEAMSAGLPVVTSDRSATAEIAGGAALLVDPEQTESIVDAVERIFTNPLLRRQLVEAGLERAAQFSWIRAAHETTAVYRKLLPHPAS